MKYIKRTGLIFLATLFFAGILTISASAQRRGFVSVGYHRPFVGRAYVGPYWHGGFGSYWGWSNPYWNDPYYTDPRLRELADRVHNENEVRKDQRKLREYNEKFNADGYISEKEQKKLDKAQRDYEKDQRRLSDGE